MAESVKLKDTYIDTEGIWDNTGKDTLNDILVHKQDYPDTITSDIYFGSNASYGMLGVTTGGDRIHVIVPVRQGYRKVSGTLTGGTIRLMAKGVLTDCTITGVEDIFLNFEGYLHFKLLLTPAVEAYTVYGIATNNGVPKLSITLSK